MKVLERKRHTETGRVDGGSRPALTKMMVATFSSAEEWLGRSLIRRQTVSSTVGTGSRKMLLASLIDRLRSWWPFTLTISSSSCNRPSLHTSWEHLLTNSTSRNSIVMMRIDSSQQIISDTCYRHAREVKIPLKQYSMDNHVLSLAQVLSV